MEKILILDSNSLLNRAFYALPLLKTLNGIYTNGILGYLTMFFKMQEEFNAKYIVATFDKKGKTFRHLAYSDYKAGRKSMPNELAEQLAPLKEILNAMNINIFELEGFEADDLIGTFSKIFEEQGFQPIIVTGDRDALQLCSDITNVIITKKGISDKEIYDNHKMIELYGVTSKEFIDVKALMGDKSDNIPGVPGIGEKGALNLIKEYKSIENLYENIESLKSGKIKNSLIENVDLAFLSKKLSIINRNVPIDFKIEELKLYEDFNKYELRDLYLKYELKSLVAKLNLKETNFFEGKKLKVNEVLDEQTFSKLKCEIDEYEGILYFDCEIIDENINSIYFKNISFGFDEKFYFVGEDILKNNFQIAFDILNSNCFKVCFDSKKIHRVMIKNKMKIKNLKFDLILASYLIDPGKEYTPLNLVNRYGEVSLSDDEKNLCICYFEQSYKTLLNKINTYEMEDLYFNIEMPLALVLAKTELEGFRVSIDTLKKLREEFDLKIKEYSEKIYSLAGEEFNINSPKQLGKILFEKLDLPVIKKTKTGYSTNAEVLEALIGKHYIIEEIINYRQITKLQSTYIIGLMEVIDLDGKIHTSFNQTITTTGRLSSTEPNLQNIPVKYPLGKEIRKVFIQDNEESLILTADYSQIELRVLAHISKDEQMINAFRENLDIHKITASEIFSVSEDDVTQEMRSRCKAVNFGIIYGISDFALAKDLKISRKEAKEYMDKYFQRYGGVKKYLHDVIEDCIEKGYVKTIFNRIRNIMEIKSLNKIVKSLGERLAMNTPIQGSAADIIKLAMIKVFNKLEEGNFKSKIILQVHDELVLNVYKNELDEVSRIVKEEMENCYKEMLVPLTVNISSGKSWFDAK